MSKVAHFELILTTAHIEHVSLSCASKTESSITCSPSYIICLPTVSLSFAHVYTHWCKMHCTHFVVRLNCVQKECFWTGTSAHLCIHKHKHKHQHLTFASWSFNQAIVYFFFESFANHCKSALFFFSNRRKLVGIRVLNFWYNLNR